MIVIKRNQQESPIDIKEIREAIDWACEGTEVSPLELESHITAIYEQEKITTSDIQMSLVDQALRMTSVERPEFRIVAARLLIMEIYKEAAYHRKYDKFGYDDYLTFVKLAVEKGHYDPAVLDWYSEVEIFEAGKMLKPEFDLDFDYAGAQLLVNRYLIRDGENVFELPQELFLTAALFLAAHEPKEKRMDLVEKFYKAIASRKISLATPILINLRRIKGNLSSCFVAAIDDSLDSIFYSVNTIAQISKNGGGVGVNLSRIRAGGASIKGVSGASGGVIPWIRIMNDTAVAVNQMGKRAGAVTTALDIWHLDIPDFLELQTENGDQRKKAYDLFPQVVIPDLFMERVEADAKWTLFDPHEVEEKYGVKLSVLWGEEFEAIYCKIEAEGLITLKKELDARGIFKQIMKSQVETGMPYLFFKDTVNRANPNKHDGMIGSGNLCQESFSNFRPATVEQPVIEGEDVVQRSSDGLTHTCNLVSLNLAVIDEGELEEMCNLSVRILDNTIDLTETPIRESQMHNDRYRTIGIGAMGLADLLAVNGIQYEKSIDFVSRTFEKIAYFSLKGSMELAKERGAYPVFEGSEWSKGNLFGKSREWYLENSELGERWVTLRSEVMEHGVRNSQLLAIAPNTSSSLLQGCSAGVMPVFSKFHIDKNANGAIPVCPPNIKEAFWYYKENKYIDQKKLVEVVAAIQQWIDQGISMELLYNLNNSLRAKDIYDTLMTAWKSGTKSVYYTRTIQKNSNIASAKEECVSCAN
jgi:ribonucleoside-diphosphate reductase alpha chain